MFIAHNPVPDHQYIVIGETAKDAVEKLSKYLDNMEATPEEKDIFVGELRQDRPTDLASLRRP